MTKSIVIVDTYYPAFLSSMNSIAQTKTNYVERHQELMNQSFGTSDVYSFHLRKLGWNASEIVANSMWLQSQWARENGRQICEAIEKLPPSYVARFPLLCEVWRRLPTLQSILEFQIQRLNPEIVYFQDLNVAPLSYLRKIRKQGKLVVGQIASPLPSEKRLRHFDLILSSLPIQIEQIRSFGVNADFLPIAFDKRVRDLIDKNPTRDIDVSFVGGMSRYHTNTVPLLSAVVAKCPSLQIFGYGAELIRDYELSKRHYGERWGIGMYDILNRSKVTLNRHISIAENFANNMRLFEATGMGSLLITDMKSNLGDYFSVGHEILAYESVEEAGELAQWALDNPDAAADIALRGQNRTLSDHTYEKCMILLQKILEKNL